MDLKYNKIGLISMLILVVLLSQSRTLDFLLETHLGRSVLLLIVIFISCTNKIFGLLAVLCIIIAFNQMSSYNVVRSYNFYEGFDVSGNVSDMSGNIASKIAAKKQAISDAIQTSSSAVAASTTQNTTESFKSREGFVMSDRELNILRGKQSNAVPVFNNSREQVDDVEPSDKSVFSSSYASF